MNTIDNPRSPVSAGSLPVGARSPVSAGSLHLRLTAVAFALVASATPALAGKDGSNAKIVAAIQSKSTDAIIAEVERAEGLMCEECIQSITNLTEDNRFAVREV